MKYSVSVLFAAASLAACATSPVAPSAPIAAPAKPSKRLPPPPPQFRLDVPISAGPGLSQKTYVDVVMIHAPAAAEKLSGMTAGQYFSEREQILKKLGGDVQSQVIAVNPGFVATYRFWGYRDTDRVIVFADNVPAEKGVVWMTPQIKAQVRVSVSGGAIKAGA
jgi:hypothetical protein